MARFNQRNNKWQVIIEIGRDERTGKRLRHTKDGFKTKRQAQIYATLKENELLNGINPMSNKTPLKTFIGDWYKDHVSKTIAINTKNNYNSMIETHIIPYMGEMQLGKIKVTDIQKFYYYLIDKDLKPSTAKKVIQVLNKCFKYAKKLNLISMIPTDIEYFTQERKQTLKVWNEDELTYFLNEIKNDYLYIPILITVLTGIRIGELCGLRWENVDLENNLIFIKEQVIQDKTDNRLIHTDILKTSKSNRKITLPSILVNVLKSHVPGSETLPGINNFVILNRDGFMCNPRNVSMEFTKKIKKYSNKTNDKHNNYMQLPQITFHDLRHTHATILLKNGENIKVISERLGHASIRMTLDTYSHVLPDMEQHTALLLDNIFSSKLK